MRIRIRDRDSSGSEDPGSWIRDKHPGTATLFTRKNCEAWSCATLQREKPWIRDGKNRKNRIQDPGSTGRKLWNMIPRYLAEGEALDAPELHVEEDKPREVEHKEQKDGAQQRLRLVHLLAPVPVHQVGDSNSCPPDLELGALIKRPAGWMLVWVSAGFSTVLPPVVQYRFGIAHGLGLVERCWLCRTCIYLLKVDTKP